MRCASKAALYDMNGAGIAGSRRVRAYAYTLVTTGIVLAFALAEWAAEKLIAAHSRAAGTAVEIAIVLVAALVFRPIHQRVEAAVDAAFHRRKHAALAALARFRRELTSFDDLRQLLRRVIEAVEQQPDASGCAVYLLRDEAFRAEASSFDQAAQPIAIDDPLIVRLRSSGAPAPMEALGSTALGTFAFPMSAAGDLVGLFTVRSRDGGMDEDEVHAFAALAAELTVALLALEPRLRPRKEEPPNNIPHDLPAIVGRGREVAEINAALGQARIVTITGPGGVGKTSVAISCARNTIGRYEDGVWFVSLAPITDERLVATTISSALDAGTSDDGDDASRLIDYLRHRDTLIVIDNCEQVVRAVATLAKRIVADCRRVRLLTTSRELLRVEGEQVYPLESLRPEAAFELFVQRAAAVAPGFDARQHPETIRRICERLDRVPLAIELAAARVRTLSVDEIAAHLHERFRLLSGGARTAAPRQQTLEAPIQWSYDLLRGDEQVLFRRIGVFRGSFTLAAAAAVCGDACGCDEFGVLDRVTSLADKSLVNVRLGVTTRYRMLETIREFAVRKAAEAGESGPTADDHALHFAAVAAQAYREFDTRIPPGWLARLAPDIDNFRAALEWTLAGGGDRLLGATLTADAAPIFLRMGLLAEGLHWCAAAAAIGDAPPATAGRIRYGASMMHNNALEYRRALDDARASVEHYRRSDDERGLVRALSQLAHQSARAGDFGEADAASREAIDRARRLGQPRLLIAVLRRCAIAMSPERIEQARALFGEALSTARRTQESEEISYVLQWWGNSEATAGCFDRAIELATEALTFADADMQLYLQSDVTGYALASGAVGTAQAHAGRALALAVGAHHPMLTLLTIAYCAPIHAQADPGEGARVLGFAQARMREMEFHGDGTERIALSNAVASVRSGLRGQELEPLLDQGAAMSEEAVLNTLFASSALGIAERVHDASRDGIVA